MSKAVVLFIALLTFSCVTIAEKRAIEQDLGALQAQLEVLRKRVDAESGEAGAGTQNQKTVAELQVTVEEMRQEMARLNSQIDASHHYLETEKQSGKRVSDDLEMRFQDLEKRLTELEKKREAAPAPAETKAPGEKKAENAETKGAPKSEKQDYEDATAALRKTPAAKLSAEQLGQSENNLQAFLKKHPQSKLKPSVHYWLGEVYYGQKDYKRAILEYDTLVTQDAKNAKAPAARLKQGYCFLALKESDKATLFFQEVVSRYPSSKEAESAKAKLAEMKSP